MLFRVVCHRVHSYPSIPSVRARLALSWALVRSLHAPILDVVQASFFGYLPRFLFLPAPTAPWLRPASESPTTAAILASLTMISGSGLATAAPFNRPLPGRSPRFGGRGRRRRRRARRSLRRPASTSKRPSNCGYPPSKLLPEACRCFGPRPALPPATPDKGRGSSPRGVRPPIQHHPVRRGL